MTVVPNIRRIAVIGAGPSGVAATKHLLAEQHFDTVDVFDQQSKGGGVWDYEPANNRHESCEIPQTTGPDVSLQKPIWRQYDGETRPTYVSAMYDRLETNIPKMLMQYSDKAFDDDLPLFPGHEQVQHYLEEYTAPISDKIQWQTQVSLVEPLEGHDGTIQWRVHTKHLPSSEEKVATYDAVLVASGHYTIPYVPDIPNLKEFSKKCTVMHSKHYSKPEEFAGKRVLLVGAGPSAWDIAAQIATTCQQPLVISTKSPPFPAFVLPHARYVAQIASFETDNDSAQVKLVDDTVLSDIDTVLFCTGYLYSYPAMPFALPAAIDEKTIPASFIKYPLTTPRADRVHHVYKHMFYMAAPSLAFLLLPYNVVPFPLAEAQGATIARVWSGRLSLPSLEEMQEWDAANAAERGSGKTFHKLAPPPADGNYLNGLSEWCAQTKPTAQPVPYMTEWNKALREANSALKIAFDRLDAAEKQRMTTLEKLGVVYDAGENKMWIKAEAEK